MAELIKIGRKHNNKELLTNPNDPTVSKVHLQLFIDDDYNVFVTDLNSANGTYVNHNKLTGPMLLEEGDILSAGNCIVKWAEYIDSLKNLETKVEEDVEDDFINNDISEVNNPDNTTIGWWNQNDDEYINGWQFLLRMLIGFSTSIILVGLYLSAVSSSKRAKSVQSSYTQFFTTSSFLVSFLIFVLFWRYFCYNVSFDTIFVFILAFLISPIVYLCVVDGKKPTILEKKLSREIDLKKSDNIVSNDDWSSAEIMAFYATLVEIAGSDGIHPNEESIIGSYLSAIGFNPNDNIEFDNFRNDALKIKKNDRYEILKSFSISKKELLSDAIKHVILADGEISEDEYLAKGLIEILANLPKSKINQKEMEFFDNLKNKK
mgnify:CR=1 FL=1